jgi:hypothetical protein
MGIQVKGHRANSKNEFRTLFYSGMGNFVFRLSPVNLAHAGLPFHYAPATFTDPMNSSSAKLKIGSQVRVLQQIAARDHTFTTDVRGTVVDYGQKQTGSWYAHGKDDKLWLDRLTLKKADGELITLNLDDYSVVEVE